MIAALLLALLHLTKPGQSGYTLQHLHDFGGTITYANGQAGIDGYGPSSSVTFGPAGDMFGTTQSGGAHKGGIVWEITAGGQYKDLHDFGGTINDANGKPRPDGSGPIAGVTFDPARNMFGTTCSGGLHPHGVYPGEACGTLWEITKAGAYVVLHDFGGRITLSTGAPGMDGTDPWAGVTLDANGNMYGTTMYGALVWELTPDGQYKDLHDFGGQITLANGKSGRDCGGSMANVTFDSVGNMYGTTWRGGPYSAHILGSGSIWELTTSGVYIDLHDFNSPMTGANGGPTRDGYEAWAGVTFDDKGNMFGTTAFGGNGAGRGQGVVWELTASGVYRKLVDFAGREASMPHGGVTQEWSGNLFGTLSQGNYGGGSVWELTTSGVLTFQQLGIAQIPLGSVTVDSTGNLYGTTLAGGARPGGMVWKLRANP